MNAVFALDNRASAAVVHVIGERPGNGHHTFSAYVAKLSAGVWAKAGVVDHNHTKSSATSPTPRSTPSAARQTVALLGTRRAV